MSRADGTVLELWAAADREAFRRAVHTAAGGRACSHDGLRVDCEDCGRVVAGAAELVEGRRRRRAISWGRRGPLAVRP